MRILLLSYYFPPDLSAGSFRAKALADALVAQGAHVELDVVTTTPNRYASHQPYTGGERGGSYSVNRIVLPKSRPGIKGQILSFVRYARQAKHVAPRNRYDVVVATSSRLMTACLGAWLSRKYGALLYLDIRDIFVETIEDVFPSRWLAPVRWFFGRLERWVLGSADAVNLVSKGFLPYFTARNRRHEYRFFTNGVDDEFVRLTDGAEKRLPWAVEGDVTHVVYAGNIGDGQGLDKVLPELADKLSGRARFTVIGDGGTRETLRRRCAQVGASVAFLDPVPREQLLDLYERADILFLHLNDYPAFERVLPSKLFEYAATGKPILAGVGGYAKEFIERELEGVAVFAPCDVGGALEAFADLDLSFTDRSSFVRRYSRSAIMSDMAEDILNCLPEKASG